MTFNEVVMQAHLIQTINELAEISGTYPEKILVRAVSQEEYACQVWFPYDRDPVPFRILAEMIEEGYLVSRERSPESGEE